MTPGAPFTPQTPGTAMDHSNADWHTIDIEVRIRETHDDNNLIHQTGVIRSVTVSIGLLLDTFTLFAFIMDACLVKIENFLSVAFYTFY